MVRLFIATFLTQKNRDSVVQFQNKSQVLLERYLNKQTRSCSTNALHLTWNFIGEVAPEKLYEIKQNLSCITQNSRSDTKDLSLEFDKFEIWPNLRSPHVAVALSTKVPKEIEELAIQINNCVEQFKNTRSKPFKPHISLFRIKSKNKNKDNSTPNFLSNKADFLKEISTNWNPINQKFQSIDLVESDLSSGIPKYNSILKVELS